jgi:hypothetical protein
MCRGHDQRTLSLAWSERNLSIQNGSVPLQLGWIKIFECLVRRDKGLCCASMVLRLHHTQKKILNSTNRARSWYGLSKASNALWTRHMIRWPTPKIKTYILWRLKLLADTIKILGVTINHFSSSDFITNIYKNKLFHIIGVTGYDICYGFLPLV